MGLGKWERRCVPESIECRVVNESVRCVLELRLTRRVVLFFDLLCRHAGLDVCAAKVMCVGRWSGSGNEHPL